MRAYIRQLRSEVHAEEATRAEKSAASIEETRERLSPLDNRLWWILASIPTEVQREGLSLLELQRSLLGRRRGSCHPGELGSALRRLGFVRHRRWTDTDGFKAVWLPRLPAGETEKDLAIKQ